MPKTVQHVVKSQANAALYTGPKGEIIVEDGSLDLLVHDGGTLGGNRISTNAENDTRYAAIALLAEVVADEARITALETGVAAAAYLSASTAANVTGEGTVVAVVLNTEEFDVGGGYDNATGHFTAPSAGKYLVELRIQLYNLTALHTVAILRLLATGGRVWQCVLNPFAIHETTSGSNVATLAISQLISCNLNDVISYDIDVNGSGSGKTVGIVGGRDTSISIHKVAA